MRRHVKLCRPTPRLWLFQRCPFQRHPLRLRLLLLLLRRRQVSQPISRPTRISEADTRSLLKRMPLSAVNSPYFKSDLPRYEQGDILRDVTLIEWADIDEKGEIRLAERTLQYCVIVSQECDLEHDFNARTNADRPNTDKYLQSLLICHAYPAQEFRKRRTSQAIADDDAIHQQR